MRIPVGTRVSVRRRSSKASLQPQSALAPRFAATTGPAINLRHGRTQHDPLMGDGRRSHPWVSPTMRTRLGFLEHATQGPERVGATRRLVKPNSQ